MSNPCFIGAYQGDYRLRYDSPALSLGFNEINFMDIGLTEYHPFENADDEIETVHVKVGDNQANIFMKTGEEIKLDVKVRTVNGYLLTPSSQ